MQSTDSVKIAITFSGSFFKGTEKNLKMYTDVCMHVCIHAYTHKVKATLSRKKTERYLPIISSYATKPR